LGRNRLSAVTNARIFDSTFSAWGSGADGYPNPDRPQAAKTTRIDAKQKKVGLDRRAIADNVRRAGVAISMRNKGAKNRTRDWAGSQGLGIVA
jgi:hypothetical protein